MKSALITDLYELTMAQSYLEQGLTRNAVFSLSVRSLPPNRNFLVSCGLAPLISRLRAFRFREPELAYLEGLRIFSPGFLGYLESFRFAATLSALPEGTIFFHNEPLVSIEGSLPDIQILETLVLNCMQYQTMAASKAARIMAVSRGKTVVDFGFRRSHMADAGIYAARAAYIAGFAGTSNLEAGKRFGIPVVGTMAHSYIMVFGSEADAFRAFAASFPDRALFLIDTYDTPACIRTVAAIAREGVPVTGVRIDSGDIGNLAREVRDVLDGAGLHNVKILVSSGVDEYSIDRWLRAGVPVDSFGVGTHFITSSDAPFLDMVYKLVEYDGRPVFKSSPGKATIPGRRQVVRHWRGKKMVCDEVVRVGPREKTAGLLKETIRDGKVVRPQPSLEGIRDRLAAEMRALSVRLRSLRHGEYRVIVRQ